MKKVLDRTLRWMITANLVFVFTCGVSAGIVEYCDVTGQDVSFTSMVETSTSDGVRYGQPFADGNTLVSSGPGFLTQSTGGDVQLIDGRLQMTITADDGFLFDEINVEMLGSYFGLGNEAMAIANSFTTVEVDGEFFDSGFTINLGGSSPTGWQDDYTISFPETDELTLTLNTQLLAASGATSASFLEASSIRLSVNAFVAAIPEPSSVWWMAIAMLAVSRRRHRSV